MIRKLAMFTIIVTLLAMKVEASEIPVSHVKNSIVKHSVAMGVDPALALSIANAESKYNHDSRSRCGAVGVFQLMPSTAKKMGFNPYSLNDNIKAGLTYYKMLYKMFGSTELALAAYHTGPAYVIKHKSPAPCSKRYIAGIMANYYHLKAHTDPAVSKHNVAKKVQVQKVKVVQAKPTQTQPIQPKVVQPKAQPVKVELPNTEIPTQIQANKPIEMNDYFL